MGLFDQDEIVIGTEPESEPVITDNHETGQSETNDEVEAPETEGQAEQSAPGNEGQAEQVNEQPKKLANYFDSEAALAKGCINISNFLGETVDFDSMSTEQKEQYYIEARRRMSQGNKPQPKQEEQQPQTQLESKNTELTELKNLLAQTLQQAQRPQPEPPKPQNVWEMSEEEFTEWLYSNPKAALQNLLQTEGAKLGQDLRGFLEPLSQARKEQEERAKWEKTFNAVKSKHEDFDSLVDDMGQVYESNPGLKDLGEAGLEMAYRMAKTQKEADLLRQKTLELIEREAQMDAQRIETMKKGASIPGSSNSKPPASGQMTTEEILRAQFFGDSKQKRGIFDD